MSAPNETIHQTVRLRVMAALNALPAKGVGLDFTRLKRLTGATDGNLGSHIDHLVRAGYVEVEKTFVGRRPKTIVRATLAGRKAFTDHVAFLQELIGG